MLSLRCVGKLNGSDGEYAEESTGLQYDGEDDGVDGGVDVDGRNAVTNVVFPSRGRGLFHFGDGGRETGECVGRGRVGGAGDG